MQGLKNFFYTFAGNLDYLGILLLIFIAVVVFIFVLVLLWSSGQSATQLRLSKLLTPQEQPIEEADRPKFLGRDPVTLATRLSRPLHRRSGHDDRSMRNRVRLRLVQAGYRSDKAFYNYLAAKLLLPTLMVLGYMVSLTLYKITADSFLIALLLILAGYYFPNFWVWLMMKSRQERIFKGLPDALDLMVVCVEAGLGLDMTFKRVGEEIQPLCKDLSDEFTLTNLEVRAGKSREEAFKNMSLRANTPEVHNLMTVLSQTTRFGTSLATALRVHADAMRIKRRQLAEETAAKSTVKLVFPLVLFIFPAIFVVIIGPGAIQIIKYLIPALSGGQ